MTEPTDFAVVISDLNASGVDSARIAREIEAGKQTVLDIATGKTKQPRFDTGVRLLQLHAAHVHPDERGPAANQDD
jgi:hypothetical protein